MYLRLMHLTFPMHPMHAMHFMLFTCALLVQTCHKRVLDPDNAAEAEAHISECVARHAHLAARLRSADVECGICLEKVSCFRLYLRSEARGVTWCMRGFMALRDTS